MSEESEAHQDLTIKALRARVVELETSLAAAKKLIAELSARLPDLLNPNEE